MEVDRDLMNMSVCLGNVEADRDFMIVTVCLGNVEGGDRHVFHSGM